MRDGMFSLTRKEILSISQIATSSSVNFFIFEAIRQLMAPPEKLIKRIGFNP
jgi:hypothetical protein